MYAADIPSSRRMAQVACAFVWCLLSGGPIFGFAALKPVLIREHIYESACDVSGDVGLAKYALDPSMFSLLTSSVLSAKDDTVAKCTPQDLKLNMMFTVAAVATNASALLIGRLLDVYGPRFCALVGAACLYFACFVFIYGDAILSHPWLWFVDPYLVGYAAMALGGPFAFISSFQLSNSFPRSSGTILALLTGAFDASLAVFLLYKLAYNYSGGAWKLEAFFKVYLIVPIFITLAQIFVMEKDSYKSDSENTLCVDDFHDEEQPHTSVPAETSPLLELLLQNHPRPFARRDSIGDALKQPYAEEGEELLIKHSGGVFGILHGYSARFQLRTPWFFLMCLFATVQMMRLNYFVATVGSQYTYLLGLVASAESLTKFFDVALPMGGVVSVPFVGLFLDNCSTVVVLAGLLSISLTIGVFGLFGNYYAGIVNVSLFVVYRPLFYTTVSDYCAKVFGFDTFGTLYGTMICISGICNFFQSVLDKITHTLFKMNPAPVNLALLAATVVIGVVTVSFVHREARLYNAKRASRGV